MRILYTAVDTPIPGRHGGSVHVLELCRALAHRGHEVHIVAPPCPTRDASVTHTSAFRPDDLQRLHVHSVSRPKRFLEWTVVGQIRRIAARLKPDVIVDRFYTFGGAGIWAAQMVGLPAVLEVNSPARPYPGSLRDRLDQLSLIRPVDYWRRQLLRWSDAVYTTSAHLVPPELQASVTVVRNGVDVKRFHPGPSESTGGPLRCVYVSSFQSWHGAEDLVDAVAACVARGVDLRVTCLGKGARWNAAREAAHRRGLLDVIQFVGSVPYDDVPGHLAHADVGLAPFDPSAFPALQLGWFWSPIKIFEYLAAGLAVVTIGIDELRQLLPDTVARFYVPGDVQGLAYELEALAGDRAALEKIRKAARALAESRFTWDHQAISVEGLLQDVVSKWTVISAHK